MVEGQAGVGQERPGQLLVITDPPDPPLGGVGHLDDGVAGEVGQLHALEVRPQLFDRVELGRIGRQPFHLQPGLLGGQPGAQVVAPVRPSPSHSSTICWPA